MPLEETKNQFDILKERMRLFLLERDWTLFHTPKNLSMSISIESAELMELFQWDDPSVSSITSNQTLFDQIKDEIADIQIYLVSLALSLEIDLFLCSMEKLDRNCERFPRKNIPSR